jgi:hypothetical protein
VTGVWALERSGWSGMAGLLVGTAAAIKLFPAYLVIYYLARGHLRPLLAAFLSFVTLTLITALILGLNTYYDYIQIVLPWNADFRILFPNISIAGLWYKLFHPLLSEHVTPLWSSLALARWGTLLSNLTITAIVAIVAYQARTSVQRDLAIAITVTAMLLVSPVTWDISLPILLAPFVLIARSRVISRSLWLSIALLLIIVIDCIPHLILKELMLGGRSLSEYPWTFMLGAPSLKFYMLIATFILTLIAIRFEAANPHPESVGGEIVT